MFNNWDLIKNNINVFEGVFNAKLYEKLELLIHNGNNTLQDEWQIQYIGELAERWESRNIISTNVDANTLILFLTINDSEDFLYNQRELFFNSMLDWIKKNPNLLTTTLLSSYLDEYIYSLKDKEKVTLYFSLIEELQKDLQDVDLSEMGNIVTISLLLSSYRKYGDDFTRDLIIKRCNYLSFNSIPKENLWIFFATIYKLYDVIKPKANEFSVKGLTKQLMSIRNICTKEIKTVSISELPCDYETALNINFKCLIENTNMFDTKVTAPGIERVINEYVLFQLEKDTPMQTSIKNKILYLKSRETWSKDSIKDLENILYKIRNVENFNWIIDAIVSNDFTSSKNSNLIKLFNNKDLFNSLSNHRKADICKNIISYYLGEKLSKDVFVDCLSLYTELTKSSIKNNYYFISKLIEFNLIDIYDINNLKKDDLEHIIHYVKDKKSFEEYIEYLVLVNKTNLLLDCDFYKSIDKSINKKRFIELYLNELNKSSVPRYLVFLLEVITRNDILDILEISDDDKVNIYNGIIEICYSKFTMTNIDEDASSIIYGLYKASSDLVKFMVNNIDNKILTEKLNLSDEKIKEIKKGFFKLENSSINEILKDKLTAEEIEEKKIKDILINISKISYSWDVKSFIKRFAAYIKKYEVIRNSLINKMLSFDTGLTDFSYSIYLLRFYNLINPMDIEILETRLFNIMK